MGAWNASEVFDGSFDSIYTTWSSLLLKREGWDHFLFPFLFVNADGIFHFPVYACTHSIMGTAWLYSLPFLSTSSLFLILWVQASSFTFILQLATCKMGIEPVLIFWNLKWWWSCFYMWTPFYMLSYFDHTKPHIYKEMKIFLYSIWLFVIIMH